MRASGENESQKKLWRLEATSGGPTSHVLTTRKEDLKLVRQALKDWGRLAYENRWGGLCTEWEKCKKAIEAFERIESTLEDQQMELPGLSGGKECTA